MADETTEIEPESFEDTAGAAWDAQVAAEEPENEGTKGDFGGDGAGQARSEDASGEGEVSQTSPGEGGEVVKSGEEKGEGEPEGDRTDDLNAPAHWAAEHQEMFRSQTPEAQAWLLGRHRAMEGAYTQRNQEMAEYERQLQPLGQAMEKWQGYLNQVGQGGPQAFETLMTVEHALRTGTMPQKRAMIAKLAQDYSISFEDESSEDYKAPDPQVTALQQQVQQLQAGQQYNILSAQQQREEGHLSEINSFAAAQTEGGQPYAPYFEEVKEDMIRMAQAYYGSGQQPGLVALYEQACWANPQVRAKMVSADRHSADQMRKSDEKERLQKAKLASGGISGTGSLSQKEQPRSVEDIASALWDESVAG